MVFRVNDTQPFVSNTDLGVNARSYTSVKMCYRDRFKNKNKKRGKSKEQSGTYSDLRFL